MAKIGNEAKLILKLAKAKHDPLRDSRIAELTPPLVTAEEGYVRGDNQGFHEIWGSLHQIQDEVESNK